MINKRGTFIQRATKIKLALKITCLEDYMNITQLTRFDDLIHSL